MRSKRIGLASSILLFAGRGNGAGAPPASGHCNENGGSEADHYTSDGGLYTLCIFEDGSACDTWMFYGGSCQRGSTLIFSDMCEESGGQLRHKYVDWGDLVGPASAKYPSCTWDDGQSECDEYSYYYDGAVIRTNDS
mmetsp:Transcript_32687/g.69655  ORF Transcript_32687/g.69655 Transcript_32687/m.69655 type:complete len:137 (-) Transcript_32687:217-627(-)